MQDRLACPNCFSIQLTKSGIEHGKQRYRCKRCKSRTVFPITDIELLKENVKYRKEKQKAQDVSRIERKSFREFARVENAVEEYSKELKQLFENYKLHTETKKHTGSNKAVGVIQFSDVHFNELVDLKNNKYDFKVAAQRCQYFVSQAKKYFRMANIKRILVA